MDPAGHIHLSRGEIAALLAWIIFCFIVTYMQVWKYATLFFTHYGPKYFPFLGGLLW